MFQTRRKRRSRAKGECPLSLPAFEKFSPKLQGVTFIFITSLRTVSQTTKEAGVSVVSAGHIATLNLIRGLLARKKMKVDIEEAPRNVQSSMPQIQ